MSGKKFLSAAEIHARVNWSEILPQAGIDSACLNGKHHPCPGCGGKDRFRFDNKYSRGNFICSQCAPKGGDGFRLVQLANGCNFSAARALVMRAAGLSDGTDNRVKKLTGPNWGNSPVARKVTTFSEYGRALWDGCVAVDGDAREYLQRRRCRIPPVDGGLRWHPKLRHPSGYTGPALVGLITDTLTNEPISLHRTWIRADGAKAEVEQPRLLLKDHRKAGGVIRLWPDEAVDYGLSIGEGIETCLAAAHGAQPIWCVIDAGNMSAFPVLSGIASLTIFADNDPAGRKAANSCAQRWARVSEVMIVCPDEIGFDIADAVAA